MTYRVHLELGGYSTIAALKARYLLWPHVGYLSAPAGSSLPCFVLEFPRKPKLIDTVQEKNPSNQRNMNYCIAIALRQSEQFSFTSRNTSVANASPRE